MHWLRSVVIKLCTNWVEKNWVTIRSEADKANVFQCFSPAKLRCWDQAWRCRRFNWTRAHCAWYAGLTGTSRAIPPRRRDLSGLDWIGIVALHIMHSCIFWIILKHKLMIHMVVFNHLPPREQMFKHGPGRNQWTEAAKVHHSGRSIFRQGLGQDRPAWCFSRCDRKNSVPESPCWWCLQWGQNQKVSKEKHWHKEMLKRSNFGMPKNSTENPRLTRLPFAFENQVMYTLNTSFMLWQSTAKFGPPQRPYFRMFNCFSFLQHIVHSMFLSCKRDHSNELGNSSADCRSSLLVVVLTSESLGDWAYHTGLVTSCARVCSDL